MGEMTASTEAVSRLKRDRDQAEKELGKVREELDRTFNGWKDGVLHPNVAVQLRNTFANAPGLGMHFNPRLSTVSEAVDTIQYMSELLQHQFDKVQELERQRDATDSMLAGAGELFLRMTEAAEQRRRTASGDQD